MVAKPALYREIFVIDNSWFGQTYEGLGAGKTHVPFFRFVRIVIAEVEAGGGILAEQSGGPRTADPHWQGRRRLLLGPRRPQVRKCGRALFLIRSPVMSGPFEGATPCCLERTGGLAAVGGLGRDRDVSVRSASRFLE